MSYIYQLVKDFWAILGEMSPYLLLGFLIAGLVSVFLSTTFVKTHLGHNSLASVVKASLFGVPLPLCSCGVMPVALSLQEAGAGKGAAISFLISTPQTGIDSIAITYSLLGPVFAIVRPIVAFVSGVFGGIMINTFDKSPTAQAIEEHCCCSSHQPAKPKGNVIKRVLHFGFVHLPQETGRAMLIGLLIASFITVLMPEDFFINNINSGLGMLVLMVFIGIPIYVCSSASVPIAAALILKGLSPGAALVFLMTGPVSNAASYVVMWKRFGAKCALIYFASVVVCALAAGLTVDFFAYEMGIEMVNTGMSMPPAWLNNTSAIALLIILAIGTFRELRQKHKTINVS